MKPKLIKTERVYIRPFDDWATYIYHIKFDNGEILKVYGCNGGGYRWTDKEDYELACRLVRAENVHQTSNSCLLNINCLESFYEKLNNKES